MNDSVTGYPEFDADYAAFNALPGLLAVPLERRRQFFAELVRRGLVAYDGLPLEPQATRSSDPWYQVGEEITRMWGHGLTCGAANGVLAQAQRFGKETQAPEIVRTIAAPGVWLVKGSCLTGCERAALVEDVTHDGLVHLMRGGPGRAERFMWALSNMVYWYLRGQLSHSKGIF